MAEKEFKIKSLIDKKLTNFFFKLFFLRKSIKMH